VKKVKATDIAIALGNHRAANTVMLGILAGQLEIPDEVWSKTLDERIPKRLLEVNRKAFEAGGKA
jgi:indolepyruvate ferredoxin oxidoreductase beta subunit